MQRLSSRVTLAALSLIGFVAVIVVNALATTLPIGGLTTGELSDLYPNLFVPAGLTFSIWGIIYLLLATYVIFGLVHSIRTPRPSDSFLDRIGVLFIVNCAVNVGWIFAWHYRLLPLSLILMLLLLASLILIYLRLDVGRSSSPTTEKYLIHLPFSVYLGWITIATIANVTVLLVHYGWNGFGIPQQTWAIVMIVVGIVIALVALFYRRDIFYTLVVDWAVLGIYLKRSSTDAKATQGILVAAIVGIGILTLGILVQVLRRRVYR